MPAIKRRKESDTRRDSEVFRDNWKDSASWPRVEGADLPEGIELPSKWLEYRNGVGMFCRLCTKYGKLPRSGVPVWTKEPCVLLRLESVTRHLNSNMHDSAVKSERQYQLSVVDGGIAAAFEKQWVAEEKAVGAAFSCVYFLAQEEIPHTTKYEPLLRLLSHLGLPHLEILNKGGNTNYTSYRIIDELLGLLSDEVKRLVQSQLEKSPYIGLICDETTDVSTTKALVVYAKAVVRAKVHTFFLALKELRDGTAPAVTESLKETVSQYGLTTERVAAMGSDGAAVMVGRENGVVARLAKEQPSLVNIHCVAHRLALAVSEAADTVAPVKRFKGFVGSLFTYFHRSSKRTGQLQASFEEVFDRPALKLREPADTRWLSCDEAIQVIRRSLDPLSVALQDLASSDAGDATALGLAGLFRQYTFVAAVFFMAEVLPILSRLSKVFQTENLPFSAVPPALRRAKTALDGLLASSQTDSADWQTDLAEWEESHNDECLRNKDPSHFCATFVIPYLQAVLKNLAGRFPEKSLAVLGAAEIFNPQNSPQTSEACYQYGCSHIVTLAEHYRIETTVTLSEWKEVAPTLRDYSTTEDVLLSLVKNRCLYPALGDISCQLLVNPMHSADSERGFSAMGRIKTRLRNRLHNRTLNSVLLISIEGPTLADFNFDKIVI